MLKRVSFAVVLLALGFSAGVVIAERAERHNETVRVETPAPPAEQARPVRAAMPPVAMQAGSGLPDFTEVAARTVPGVTNISSLQVMRQPSSPFGNDPFFRFFFGDDPDMFGYRERRGQSAGSGVVVSPDGYVLTNNHVVEEAHDPAS